MTTARTGGYTLIEIVVALLLFAIGGLALVTTSAVIGRAMNTDAVRERAARIGASRLEIIGAACHSATSGRETLHQIDSEWSITPLDSVRLSVIESVSYPSPPGRRTDLFRAVLPCR